MENINSIEKLKGEVDYRKNLYSLDQSNVSADRDKPSLKAETEQHHKKENLVGAGYEVLHYLRNKRIYSATQEHVTLENTLEKQLTDYRSASTTKVDHTLVQNTQQGLGIMKSDYEKTQKAVINENEQYIRERNFLSPKGIEVIRGEADKGEFRMPNGQQGRHVQSHIHTAEEKLSTLQPSSMNYQLAPGTSVGADRSEKPLSRHEQLKHDYPKLSEQDVDRYARIMQQRESRPLPSVNQKNFEIEL